MTDYTDFRPKVEQVAQSLARHWWQEEDSKKAAEAVFSTLEALEEQQMDLADRYLRDARLYGNRDLEGFGLGQFQRSTSDRGYQGRISLNIVKACVDTVTSKVSKNRPRANFLTDGGTFEQREKAKKLNKFTEGLFHETRLYEIAPQVRRDAQVLGTGCVKVFEKDGRVAYERVLVTELFVDEAEAIHGEPRQLFHRKTVSRELVLALFGDTAAKRELILNAEKVETGGQTYLGDMIRVVEAWHLPSGRETGDGAWRICVSTGTLEQEEWRRPYFPFAMLRWARPQLGFWGESLTSHLAGIQLEINKLLQRIQKMMHFSVPRVFVHGNAKIAKGQITNEIGSIIQWDGMHAPVFSAPSFVPPEYFMHLERLYRWAFEEAGVSQMSASSQKPAGLNSGRALREYNDIEAERFTPFAQADEQFFVDCAEMGVDFARDIACREEEAEKDGDGDGDEKARRGYRVRLPGKRGLEDIDFLDIDLERDAYVIKVFPVSSLPSTPAARQQTVAEWIEAGWVSPEEGRRLLDFPDLEQSTNLAVAQLDDLDFTFDSILSKGDYLTPEPYQALELGIPRAMAAYLRARSEGYPEDRLELMRRWIEQARELLQQPAPPAMDPAAAALPPGAPPMPPGMPPAGTPEGVPPMDPSALPPMPPAPPLAA